MATFCISSNTFLDYHSFSLRVRKAQLKKNLVNGKDAHGTFHPCHVWFIYLCVKGSKQENNVALHGTLPVKTPTDWNGQVAQGQGNAGKAHGSLQVQYHGTSHPSDRTCLSAQIVGARHGNGRPHARIHHKGFDGLHGFCQDALQSLW